LEVAERPTKPVSTAVPTKKNSDKQTVVREPERNLPQTRDFPPAREAGLEGFFDSNRPARWRAQPWGRRDVGEIWYRLGDGLWVDMVMILLTVIGVVWVVANFDAVTTIIAAGIGKLLQTLIGLFLVVCLIVGVVLLFSNRRRRFF